MMRKVIGPIHEFTAGMVRYVETESHRVMVCNVDGELHACASECPHRGANLAQGQLQGHMITCPWHEWAFDVRTGEGITNPVSGLQKYEVTIEGEMVVLTLPASDGELSPASETER